MTNRFNILLVGNLENTFSSEQELKNNDIDIFTESDPEKGLDIMFKNDIDLLLIDISMPKISGFEFVEFLKESRSLSQLSIIFITETSNTKDELYAYNLGAHDYIQTLTMNEIVLSVKIKNHISMLKKRKNDLNIIQKNQEQILTQSRMLAIAEIVKNTIHIATKSLSLISMMTNSIQHKISSKNL